MQKYDFFKVLLQYVFQGFHFKIVNSKYLKMSGIRTQEPENFSIYLFISFLKKMYKKQAYILFLHFSLPINYKYVRFNQAAS